MNILPFKAGAGDAADAQSADLRMEPQRVKPRTSSSATRAGGKFWLAKKTVLLVDVDPATREARSKVMRSLGVTVHCAATVNAARQKLESGAYNLVLVDPGSNVEGAKLFAEEIRARNSRQLVAFLVGSPLFVATSLDGDAVATSAMPRPRAVPVQKAGRDAPVSTFGQEIRDAESEEVA